jgi:hypothetical protein
MLAVFSACACAQDFNPKPKSPSPDELPGKQLIVWTETQKPQPLPVTSPEMYASSSHIQILTGTILAQGSDLLFASSEHVNYRIANDSQEQLRAVAGKNVRISGNVDQAARSVHLVSIAPR